MCRNGWQKYDIIKWFDNHAIGFGIAMSIRLSNGHDGCYHLLGVVLELWY